MEDQQRKTAGVLYWWTGRGERGVVYPLRFRKATFFSLEKDAYLHLTEAMEWMWINANLNRSV